LNSTTVLDQSTLIKAVPVFVALMVWLIRILIIGSLSMAGDRLIGHGNRHHFNHYSEPIKTYNPHPAGVRTTTPASAASSANIPVSSFQPSPRMAMRHDAATSRQVIPIRNNETSPSRNEARKNPLETPAGRPEPVYQPLSTGSKTSSQINLM
jgi:hypothetical protein